MPRYAQINCDVYEDLINEGFSPKAIYVYLFYAITSQNLIGIYRTRPTRDRVSANADRVSWEKGKEELEKKGKIRWVDGWVWIIGKAKKVLGKKQEIAARKLVKELDMPEQIKIDFIRKYPHLGYPIDGVSADALPIPIPKEKRIKRKYSFSSEHLRRAKRLKALMLENDPQAKIPKDLSEWADTVRLTIERDKRTLMEIDEVIEWSQEDQFWKAQILSMGKLREKFGTLKLQMQRKLKEDKQSGRSDISPDGDFNKTGYTRIPSGDK